MPDEVLNEVPVEYELSDREVVDRIHMMDDRLKNFRDADAVSSQRYLDANATYIPVNPFDAENNEFESPSSPEEVPIGQPNYLAVNNETRIAAVAMRAPKLYIRANENEQKGGVPDAAEIVSKAWEDAWENGNWRREVHKALQKFGICGMGVILYRWDGDYGPCFEHIPSHRLLIDPHATNKARLEYGGVHIRISLRKAERLYDPKGRKGIFSNVAANPIESKNKDNQTVKITLYWDRDSERHVYNDKVIHSQKNFYDKVPLIFIEAYVDPRGYELPLGDNMFASGLNQEVVDLAEIMSNMAKHGGQITVADKAAFTETTQKSLEEGKQQEILFTKGPINRDNPPIHRVAAEQPSPAWNEARREAQTALDGIMGVSPGQRGEQIPNVTATQSVMVEQKSGARTTMMQADTESLLAAMARAFVFMMKKFGGPTADDIGFSQTRAAWEAFNATFAVAVVAGSSSYRNPAADMQVAMQLYTTITQTIELWLGLAQTGSVQKIPNLEQYVNDMLIASSRENHDMYWTQAPPPQPPAPEAQSGKSPEEMQHEAEMQQRDQEFEAAKLDAEQQHESKMKGIDLLTEGARSQAEDDRTREQMGHEQRTQGVQQKHDLRMARAQASLRRVGSNDRKGRR